MQTDIHSHAGRQEGRQTDRQADRQTDRQKCAEIISLPRICIKMRRMMLSFLRLAVPIISR